MFLLIIITVVIIIIIIINVIIVVELTSLDAEENVSRVVDDTTINVDAQGPVKFSVWVSFAEIYNETIHDLLEPCPMGKGKKRTTLRLGDDSNGNPYIKGESEFHQPLTKVYIPVLHF